MRNKPTGGFSNAAKRISCLLLSLVCLQACAQNNTGKDSSSTWPCKYYGYQNCSDGGNSGSSQGENSSTLPAMQWAKSASGSNESSFKGTAIEVPITSLQPARSNLTCPTPLVLE